MEIIDDFARFYPAAIIIYALMINDIYLFMFLIISNLVNGVLKYRIAKPLMGDKYYPILGKGIRPKEQQIVEYGKILPDITKSYGMPSGHSQEAGFATYMILKNMSYGHDLLDIRNIILTGLAIFIAYSRVYLNLSYSSTSYNRRIIWNIIWDYRFHHKNANSKQINKSI